jgi:ABC-type Fe3+-hydroxamate transport system substrate-binding protein
MGQMGRKLSVASCELPVLILLLLADLTCQKSPARTAPNSTAKHPTVASLVPAATDLIVQMGLADHLVGISNYDDTAALGLTPLPRVGDYQNIDWERVNHIRPDILIIFESPDRVPAGLRQRAEAMHMRLVNVRTETIANIAAETRRLGDLLGEKAKANDAVNRFQNRLDAIRHRVAGLPKVRTLLVRDPATLAVVGADNFLDDALKIAGGENVISARGWPNIDRETLRALRPQAVIVLLTEQTPQARAAAQKFLDSVSTPSCRTSLIAHWYVQQSSFYVTDVAEQLADDLHPRSPASVPAERRP